MIDNNFKKIFSNKQNFINCISTGGIILSILLSSSCSLFPTNQTPNTVERKTIISETPEKSKEEAPAALPKLIDYPPDLVETRPYDNGTINASDGIIFFFNQPVNKNSFANALQISPRLDGSFDWQDDSTVVFFPISDLIPDMKYTFSINQDLLAENGLNLLSERSLTFQSPKSLQVTEQLPRPGGVEISPDSAIVVSFNVSIVPLSDDPDTYKPAFQIQPQVTGHGTWLNTSTYIFYPENALFGGTNYSIKIDETLLSSNGFGFNSDDIPSDWSFSTAQPKIISVSPVEDYIPLDSAFIIEFNQTMDIQDVEKQLSFKDDKGNPISGSLIWSLDQRVLTYQPHTLLERDSTYFLLIPEGTKSLGQSALPASLRQNFFTVPDIEVESVSVSNSVPLETYNGFGTFLISFTAPLGKQKFQDLFNIKPEVINIKVNDGFNDQTLQVSGYFEPGQTYEFTLSENIVDQWGLTLKETFDSSFKTASLNPSIHIPILKTGIQNLFLTTKDRTITASTINIPLIAMESSHISLNQFIAMQNSYILFENYSPISPVESWQQNISQTPDTKFSVELPLPLDDEELTPGFYYFRVWSPEVSENTFENDLPFLAVVSPTNLFIKKSADQITIWAVDIESNLPISNLLITIMGKDGQILGDCTSLSNGICKAILPDQFANNPIYVISGQPGDDNFAFSTTRWNSGVAGWEFGYNTHSESDLPFSYLYTDRPIYRPGQEVKFRGIIKQTQNGRYTPVDQTEVTLNVYGEYPINHNLERKKVTSANLPISNFGSFNGEFTLPEDLDPGHYSIELQDPDNATVSFQVANYRKPEIDLHLTLDNDQLLMGENLQFTINGQYYFGAPAAHQKIEWSIYAKDSQFAIPNGYQSGSLDMGWMQPYWMSYLMGGLGSLILGGEGQLDQNGQLWIEIPFAQISDEIDNLQLQEITVEITLHQELQEPVSEQASFIIHPGSYYIGIRSEAWSVEAGSPLGFSIKTVDWDNQISGEHELSAQFSRITFETVEKNNKGFDSPDLVPIYEAISSTTFMTDQLGQARLEFIPPDPGTYVVTVTGNQGKSEILTWVSGSGSANWPKLPNQQIPLNSNAGQYKVGDEAQILIPNPFKNGALAFITAERGEIMQEFVFEIDTPSYKFSFPIEEIYAPNAYISVTLLGKSPDGHPDFRQGYLNLPVDPENHQLNINLGLHPEQGKPGEELSLNFSANDVHGNPVEGEFSISLVDKAVLALADPNSLLISEAFYGEQRLGVINSQSLSAYANRLVDTDSDGGIGGGQALIAPILRENFQDTAYWNGAIQTDSDGKAELHFSLPDNTTTWVADLRGITKDSLVGESTRELIVTKELLIQPQLGRFFVSEDHVEISARVHNNSSQNLETTVTLQAVGFEFDDPNKMLHTVNIPANKNILVSWWGSIQNVDEVSFVFKATSGEFEDTTTPENGNIPVLQYSTSQTFSTSGILNQQEERLELVSLPKTYIPNSGDLLVEITPSLVSLIIDSLEILEENSQNRTEFSVSRLLPNLTTFSLLQNTELIVPDQTENYIESIKLSLDKIISSQNSDGGWGWAIGSVSDNWISAYTLLGIVEANSAGFTIPAETISKAQDYLSQAAFIPGVQSEPWELDRLSLVEYALAKSNFPANSLEILYDNQEKLSPWSTALLALSFSLTEPLNEKIPILLSSLESSAIHTSTGLFWQDASDSYQNAASNNYNTAVVIYALSIIDPASPLIPDAVQYLLAHRYANGAWSSSYESAWTIMALKSFLQSSGDFVSDYQYHVELNNERLLEGIVEGIQQLKPSHSKTSIENLDDDTPNALQISRTAGKGSLYYRTLLNLNAPILDSQPVDKGMNINRFYAFKSCTNCDSIQSLQLSTTNEPLMVHLTLTIPEDMYYVVVEDFIPAGFEIIDKSLNTSQIGGFENEQDFDETAPFMNGWGWWIFSNPKIYDERIQWIGESVPAGTYELTYEIMPVFPGEFQTLPAHAYMLYFPEIEGSSAGSIFTITH
ncbi:MAG: Ig-like domain-containing protein [Anaerolineaceae bacterium]|nr:Ig-like domain-containing protein [Anaerolineaceae bacterium]